MNIPLYMYIIIFPQNLNITSKQSVLCELFFSKIIISILNRKYFYHIVI